MTETMDVPLNREMISLAALGRMPRMAWGSTIRRSCRSRGMPSAAAARSCPGSTDSTPPRTISAAYAAWCSARPITAAVIAPIRCSVSNSHRTGPNGMPKPSSRYR